MLHLGGTLLRRLNLRPAGAMNEQSGLIAGMMVGVCCRRIPHGRLRACAALGASGRLPVGNAQVSSFVQRRLACCHARSRSQWNGSGLSVMTLPQPVTECIAFLARESPWSMHLRGREGLFRSVRMVGVTRALKCDSICSETPKRQGSGASLFQVARSANHEKNRLRSERMRTVASVTLDAGVVSGPICA